LIDARCHVTPLLIIFIDVFLRHFRYYALMLDTPSADFFLAVIFMMPPRFAAISSIFSPLSLLMLFRLRFFFFFFFAHDEASLFLSPLYLCYFVITNTAIRIQLPLFSLIFH